VRILTQARLKSSCKPLFKALEIYVTFNDFMVSNVEYFTFNFSVHSIITKKK